MISTTEDDSVNSGEDIQVLEANKTPLSGLRFQILLDLVEFLVQQTSVPFLEILRLFSKETFFYLLRVEKNKFQTVCHSL